MSQTLRIEHERDVRLEDIGILHDERDEAGPPATQGPGNLTLEVCASAYITMAYSPQYIGGAQPMAVQECRTLAHCLMRARKLDLC